jgi:CheY-like chemotaxis protein
MALILIIDDSAYMRRTIRGILKTDGYEIREAEDGLKGLQEIKTNPPDGIILDLIMPGIDGFKILKVLSEERSKIPVVVVTADIQESVRKQCLELGAVGFINKPPKEDELRAAMKHALEVKRGVSR